MLHINDHNPLYRIMHRSTHKKESQPANPVVQVKPCYSTSNNFYSVLPLEVPERSSITSVILSGLKAVGGYIVHAAKLAYDIFSKSVPFEEFVKQSKQAYELVAMQKKYRKRLQKLRPCPTSIRQIKM